MHDPRDAESDARLESQFLANRDSGFSAVYARYATPLFRFIYRFTGDSQRTEEILHDVFVQLLDGHYRTDGTPFLKSWLYTVAKNKALNVIAKQKFESSSAEILTVEPADAFDGESQLIQKDLQEKLHEFQDQLPKDLRDAWGLRRDGLDNQQIATILAIPVGTVKSRFFRLVEHFKKEFANEGRG